MADYLVDQLQWEVHGDLELPSTTLDQECQTRRSVWDILLTDFVLCRASTEREPKRRRWVRSDGEWVKGMSYPQ